MLISEVFLALKDMWAVKSREASLRRRLTEHYASILTWETNRLQTALRSASSTPQPFPPFQSTLDRSDSVLSKGKSRETELDIEVKRLNSRVRELEELVGDAGECEAVVHTELKNVQRQFDGHRSKTEEYRASLEREIQALQGQLRDAEEKHAHYRTREEDSRVQGIEGLRSILAPLLDRTSIPEEETLEDLALVVQDAFKGLEAKLEALRGEIKESQDGVERERARLVKEAERSYQDSLTKERKWDEERGGYLRQVKELCVPGAVVRFVNCADEVGGLQIHTAPAPEEYGCFLNARARQHQCHALAPLEYAPLGLDADVRFRPDKCIVRFGQGGWSAACR